MIEFREQINLNDGNCVSVETDEQNPVGMVLSFGKARDFRHRWDLDMAEQMLDLLMNEEGASALRLLLHSWIAFEHADVGCPCCGSPVPRYRARMFDKQLVLPETLKPSTGTWR